MNKSQVIEYINSSVTFQNIKEEVVRNENSSIKYLNGSSVSFLIHYLSSELKRPILVVSESKQKLNDIKFDFESFFEVSDIAEFTKNTQKNSLGNNSHYGKVIDALVKLENKNFVAVSDTESLMETVPQKSTLNESKITLSKGENIDFEKLKNELAYNGFDRENYVSKQGQFAVRGGILDIFPLSFDNPIRLEFWGNELESIRLFDFHNQRSIKEYDEIEFISKVYHEENTSNDSDIFSYIPKNTLIITLGIKSGVNEDGSSLIPDDYAQLGLNLVGIESYEINTKEQLNFNSSIKLFSKHLQENTLKGQRIVICADGKIHLSRIKELIESSLEEDENSNLASPSQTLDNIIWIDKTISEGFTLSDENISIYTEHQLFNRHRNVTSKSDEFTRFSLKEIKELNIGDLVVHDDKGVGRFEGFKTVEIGGNKQDCIQLAFQGGDKLFVNLNYISKIQKYSATEGELPKLSKLGSTEWTRKKARIKKKIKDISRGLIKLYAKRKLQKGFTFDSDNVWQKEFEASFIYEDTPDQVTATNDIKQDMESENSMDRLVCGDVGFGKTEVAIRAAFKAVQSGKQVAVLVPTTVLAQQHYMSFVDRMNNYPVNVDVISRFRTKKEQTKILERLAEGKIDILIGTHRILSKDIEFKNLGLLIVDEEQRFGVTAKEKLRKARETLDTLTLTATPIPRTLNFSLMGARDLSIIETPPRNRLPIQTQILEWDADEITDVIDKEIKRDGQVFFVNDTVKDLEDIQAKLKMLLPSVKFSIAHGQMKTTQLEKIMQDFISGKSDVLLTTKIVESGLDIPNANTMIINNAQNFGLAELYQLRGRVGRGNMQAYCHLIVPMTKKLNEIALKRLKAIEEFTDLGSGFNLSLRDMEIRGAGNLLGAEQSGAIYDIGFELYQKILEEAVKELKLEEFQDIFDPNDMDISDLFANEEISIELDKDAFIPEDYISSETDRFSYYKKLYSVEKNSELIEIRKEFEDKYGRIPREVENLLFVVKLRSAAVSTGLDKIVIKPNKIILVFPDESNEQYYKEAFPTILDYLQTIEGTQLKQGKLKLTCEIPIQDKNEASELLWKLKRSMEYIEL
ncbi:MAG: transcription-repair coupling factor [Chlorobiota bacterium]